MRKINLGLLLLFLWSLPSIAAAIETYRYQDKKLRFSVNVPKTWTKNKDNKDPKDVMFLSPKEDETDLRENISITIFEADPSVPLEDYEAAFLGGVKKRARAFKVLDEGRDLGSDGKEAIWALYTFKMGDFTAKQIVYFKMQGRRGIYIIDTAIAETYDQFQNIFNDINASLHLE